MDLTIIGKYKTEKIYDYCLYFSTDKEYTPLELERRLVEEKYKILEKLEKRFGNRIKVAAKPYIVESMEVKEEWEDFILTDKGCISKRAILFCV